MLCGFKARCNGTHTFQKVQVLSNQSTEYLPKKRQAFMFFLVSSSFCLRYLPWMPFLPSLFLIVESGTLTLIEASGACSSLDVVLGCFMTSWMSCRCTLGVILVDWPLLQKVHHCSKFSPFVDNGSDHGSLESQSLRNGFNSIQFKIICISLLTIQSLQSSFTGNYISTI